MKYKLSWMLMSNDINMHRNDKIKGQDDTFNVDMWKLKLIVYSCTLQIILLIIMHEIIGQLYRLFQNR